MSGELFIQVDDPLEIGEILVAHTGVSGNNTYSFFLIESFTKLGLPRLRHLKTKTANEFANIRDGYNEYTIYPTLEQSNAPLVVSRVKNGSYLSIKCRTKTYSCFLSKYMPKHTYQCIVCHK